MNRSFLASNMCFGYFDIIWVSRNGINNEAHNIYIQHNKLTKCTSLLYSFYSLSFTMSLLQSSYNVQILKR